MSIKRILVFALALMVMAMPVGFAESGYGALTLSNFHVEMTGMDAPLDVDAALKIGVGGQDDGTGRMDIEVTGGGQTAVTASAGFDAEAVRAIVGGSSYYFEIPMADLQKLGEESMQSSTAASSLSSAEIDQIKGMMESYVKYIQKYADPENALKLSSAMRQALNAESKGKESVDLFGETVELNRFDVALDGAGIGKLYDTMLNADPDLKAFFTQYIDMLAKTSGEEIPLNPDDIAGSVETLLKEQKVDIAMNLSLWVDTQTLGDENAKALKQTATISVTNLDPGEGEEAKTVDFPYTMSILDSEAGTRMAMDMRIAPPDKDQSVAFTFDGTFGAPADGGTQSNATLIMSFDGEGTTQDLTANMTFDGATGADGVADFSFGMNGATGGQAFEMAFAYDGQTATETEKAGTIRFDLKVPAAGVTLVFTCDTLVESSAFSPLGDADFAGKTMINPVSASEEEMAPVTTELQGVLLQAYGVLMQTPGLSNLIGGAMNAGAAG